MKRCIECGERLFPYAHYGLVCPKYSCELFKKLGVQETGSQ